MMQLVLLMLLMLVMLLMLLRFQMLQLLQLLLLLLLLLLLQHVIASATNYAQERMRSGAATPRLDFSAGDTADGDARGGVG